MCAVLRSTRGEIRMVRLPRFLVEQPGGGVVGRQNTMKVIADLCVVPIGVGVSVSEYVAVCQEVLAEAGLDVTLHAYGTNIEGEWDEVMEAIKRCHEMVHGMGAPRISTTLKLGTRTDREQTMQEKIDSVNAKL